MALDLPQPGANAHRAAAYLRMSRATQDQSPQHQLDAITRYAAANGLAVTHTYIDAGHSGLKLENRPGLLALLQAVSSEHCGFSVVLVYDVSRWGRFQDADESAYCEHLCSRHGVSVQYCAESFGAERTPINALLKSIKRIMAAEYSRDLGVKVWAAQARFSSLGYKQGGQPGYALRRISVSADGSRRTALLAGERKSSATDRVALAHGPAAEVATVRRIYRLYVQDGLTDRRIAALLRQQCKPRTPGRSWTAPAVRRILTNRRYCGDLLYNQTSRRMGGAVTPNQPEVWICCKDALAPMVDRSLFEQAQQIRSQRTSGPQREAVLQQLRAIHQRHGTISIALCRRDPALPADSVIRALFGTYARAYIAAGLPPARTVTGALGYRSSRIVMADLLAEVARLAASAGGNARDTHRHNFLLLNDAVLVKITVASCRLDAAGHGRWRIPLRLALPADFVLCALLDRDNSRIERYVLLARDRFTHDAMFLSEQHMARVAGACHVNLARMFGGGENSSLSP
jgi:DNA invertase Pin-like site-specific DNA recombinase